MITIQRRAEGILQAMLAESPAVILVGARRVGKTSLAQKIAATRPHIIYDLEKDEDRAALRNHGVELRRHSDKLAIIDEVQHKPELFAEIRTIIDELASEGRATGKFLLLGSVARDLQNQSESLAGRVMEMRLHPVDWLEIASTSGAVLRQAGAASGGDEKLAALHLLWGRGGLPQSLLAKSDADGENWLRHYLDRTITRDAITSRAKVRPEHYLHLLKLIAFKQGSIIGKNELFAEMDKARQTVNAMLEVLEDMMLIRRLPAWAGNKLSNMRKTAKYYICDSGIFHHLVNRRQADLKGQGRTETLLRGSSWEGFAIQNCIAAAPEGWQARYCRTKTGKEIDLIFEKPGGKIWAIEIKSGDDTSIDKSFLQLCEHLHPERAFLVHGGLFKHRSPADVSVVSLPEMMNELTAQDRRMQQPARSPAADLPQSPELVAVLEDVRAGNRSLNIRRNRFVDHFLGRTKRAIAESSPNAWIQARNELLAWLEEESVSAPDGTEAQGWQQRLTAMLEGLGDLSALLPLTGNFDRPFGEFSQLCCYDAFVHATAVLLNGRCHAAVGGMAARDYYMHGEMVTGFFFWSAADKQPGKKQMSPHEFVMNAPAAAATNLLEADLLLMLNGRVLALRKSNLGEKYLSIAHMDWLPWTLFDAAKRPPLPLFGRAKSAEGMQNLLICLGLAPVAADKISSNIKEYINEYLDELNDRYRGRNMSHDLARCLNLEQWHQLR